MPAGATDGARHIDDSSTGQPDRQDSTDLDVTEVVETTWVGDADDPDRPA